MSRSSLGWPLDLPGDARHAEGPRAESALLAAIALPCSSLWLAAFHSPLDQLREPLNRSLSSAIG